MIDTDVTSKQATPEIFQTMEDLAHEQVVFCHDKYFGLKAIIGIHNTILGPAMGGTRMWNYENEQQALNDVLRLSRGMTLKSAIAGLNIGGGKAVIIGDARKIKNEALMRRFGKFVNSLGGKYWTAEDVNMTTRDMEYIHMETPYVTGLPESMGGSGDPSPVTAYGVYLGIKASSKKLYGSDSLEGRSVLVQGAGHVGGYLIDYLIKENCKVYISDIFSDKLKIISNKHKVHVMDPDKIFDFDYDIYSPCALGGTVNNESIAKMKCNIIAGGANNQLENEKVHGAMLKDKNIIYAPDFLINSGGIINVYQEKLGNYNREKVYRQTENIYEVCLKVLNYADKNNLTSHESALQLALDRINDMGSLKLPL